MFSLYGLVEYRISFKRQTIDTRLFKVHAQPNFLPAKADRAEKMCCFYKLHVSALH